MLLLYHVTHTALLWGGLQERPSPEPGSPNPWGEPSHPDLPGRSRYTGLHTTSHHRARLSSSTVRA